MIGLRAATALAALAAVGVYGLAGCTAHGQSAGSVAPSTATTATAPLTGLGGGQGEGSPSNRGTASATPTQRLSEPSDGTVIDKACPYASNDEFRDAEGDRTVHSVQLSGTPVGCRYFFEYDSSVIIGEIRIQKFPDSTAAFNAMVRAGRAHPELVDDKTIGDYGSISIKLPLQGVKTWACLFTKGNLVITAHSRQEAVSQDARNIARVVAPRIT